MFGKGVKKYGLFLQQKLINFCIKVNESPFVPVGKIIQASD